jgi:hypothetical protein
MAASRRKLPGKSAQQLTRRTRRRAALVAVALLALGASVAAHESRLADIGTTTLRVPALDLIAWTRIASDLEDRVPARLLLGGAGPNEELDTLLRTLGLLRSDFQQVATMVVRKVGENAEMAAWEDLMVAFQAYPLPNGIEIPENASKAVVDRSVEIEEARRLVLTLTARLHGPAMKTENT